MVLEQQTSNGEQPQPQPAPVSRWPELPELITISRAEASQIPSAGALRALKAETGKEFDQLCGADADGADRTQTLVWVKLRRTFPGLRWADCDEVTVQVEDGALAVDPTKLAASATLQGSAVSGG